MDTPTTLDIPSPAFVIDLDALAANMSVLAQLQHDTGARILHALKAFAMWSVFPEMSSHLAGCCASGIHEARLAAEKFGGELHTHSPAFTASEIDALLPITDHLTFNSIDQWQRHLSAAQKFPAVRLGLRVNPQHSTGHTPLYDPCAPGSRLGITAAELDRVPLADFRASITGLHFHTLCEQGADDLATTVQAFEEKFARWLPHIRWLNLGGGHHITRTGYDLDHLHRIIAHLRDIYGVTIYLEPGEASVLATGSLHATVIDILPRDPAIAILDVSATAHMPDVLEMPYRPDIRGATAEGDHCYELAGPTCLAGDHIGRYSFARPLHIGDRVIFEDMAHYTMVKTTQFNGVPHPALCTYRPSTGELSIKRRFTYADFRDRMS